MTFESRLVLTQRFSQLRSALLLSKRKRAPHAHRDEDGRRPPDVCRVAQAWQDREIKKLLVKPYLNPETKLVFRLFTSPQSNRT